MRVHVEKVGEVGIVHDRAPRLVPANGWTGGRNFSTYADSINTVKGYKSTIKTPDHAPYWLLPWQQTTTQHWIYAGYDSTNAKMVLRKITDASTEADVSRASADYTAAVSDRWSGAVLGGLPVCTNGVDEPQVWNSGTGKFVDMSTITGWDTNDTCAILIAHRNFLIAADCTESGVRSRSVIRWSQNADPGSLPSTWDENDTTKIAGRTELSQSDDPIVDIRQLGDDLYIYKTQSVWRMTFVETSLIVWDFAPVFTAFGAAALDCAADLGDGHHAVFTGTDLKIHDGRQAKSVLSGRTKTRLPKSISKEAKLRSFLTIDKVSDELWFCYPGQSSTQTSPLWPDKVFIVNWETGDTGFRDIPPTASAAIGDLEDYESDVTWNSVSEYWDVQYYAWNDVFHQGRSNMILCAHDDTKFYGANLAYTLDGDDLVAHLERLDLPLEGFDPDEVKTVTSVYPKVTVGADYTIDIYVGARMEEEGSIAWKGPFSFNPDSGRKVDVLTTGVWISMRFHFRGKSPVSLSGYSLDVEKAGWR